MSAPVCERCDSPVERDDLRCPICSQAVPDTSRADEQTPRVQILRCRGCGAAVSYSAKDRAPRCAFCGSVMQLETTADPMEQTEHFLPFRVDRDRAIGVYRRWLRGLGLFRPSDLTKSARLESMKALWWVGWVFEADARVSWTADSNGGARKAPLAPHAGQLDMPFRDVLVPATRGLSPDETTRLTGSYDLGTACTEPKNAEGETMVEQFDVRRSSARQQVAESLERLAVEEVKDGHVPGSVVRQVKVAILLRRLVTLRYAFPAYVVAYRYRGRLFRTVISGQDATCVLGSAPYSLWKILGAVGGTLLFLILVLWLLSLAG